ncbi:hypothetical protein MYX82_03225 [Acidobacteria bacterium AH-259-D05]|nr:hypothetical protein [Acidobacteria bacterium AH-259-D05]
MNRQELVLDLLAQLRESPSRLVSEGYQSSAFAYSLGVDEGVEKDEQKFKNLLKQLRELVRPGEAEKADQIICDLGWMLIDIEVSLTDNVFDELTQFFLGHLPKAVELCQKQIAKRGAGGVQTSANE